MSKLTNPGRDVANFKSLYVLHQNASLHVFSPTL
jgi:hypothetical protein